MAITFQTQTRIVLQEYPNYAMTLETHATHSLRMTEVDRERG